MTLKTRCALGVFLPLLAATVAQPLDPGFKERAIAHVRQLAAFGNRVAESEGESKAAVYIRQQMEKAGLEVVIEPFEIQSYALEAAVLATGSQKAEIIRLGFDPYAGGDHLGGALVFVESTRDMGSVMKMDLDDKIVVTTAHGNFNALAAFKKPRAIVSLSPDDYQRLQVAATANGGSGEIAYRGKAVTIRSANVVGTLTSGSTTGRPIILSAHYDSWSGPGANDNASGVAVLLELARHFQSRKPAESTPMRFVAFGAEEIGLMGAKAYLERHLAELRDCRLLFNMDTVGGGQEIYTETASRGREIPATVENRLPRELRDKAMHDIGSRWTLVNGSQGGLFDDASVPQWVRAAVSEAGKELSLDIKASGGMGSDHRAFMQAGVAATNIAITGGAALHTAADVAEEVKAESLETAARVVSTVVEKAMLVGK